MKKVIQNLLISTTFTLLLIIPDVKLLAQTNVVIPGDFQSELGCPGDWMPDCDNAALAYNSGIGLWEGTFNIPAGSWQYKVAIDHSWTENYGADGIRDGANISLVLPAPTNVTFKYDPVTHFITDSYNNITVTIAGSFQSELGCAGDWLPDCTNTDLSLDPVTGKWKAIFNIPTGNWEFKVTINHSWGENYGDGGVPGGANILLSMPVGGNVAFTYDPLTHIVTTSMINSAVVLAGSFQSELGCSGDWQPDCSATGLVYDGTIGKWKREFTIPAGNWEFKVTIDNSWTENYGDDGVPNGSNIVLNLTDVSKVFFMYDPITHIVTYTANATTVVLPGTFQSELGCTPVTYVNGDWEPACDFTRLTYDPVAREWVGTFDIGAGYWEYKVAIDNSWGENYGAGGELGGANIPLKLVFPSNITFKYDPVTHTVRVINNTNTIGFCVNKFYDANVNGIDDDGELPIEGVTFNLSGDSTAIQATGSDGKICFADLKPGNYTATEIVPVHWIPTTTTSQSVTIGQPQNLYFGNVCLGAGGSRNVAYWMNKKGLTTINTTFPDWILYYLDFFSLRNEDGSDFDPATFKELQTWMQKANARNMAYKLSVQMAAMILNLESGFVNTNAIVYMPGCGNMGIDNNFSNIYPLIWQINSELMIHPNTLGNDPDRAYQDCLRNALENANNNLNFVQTGPCSVQSVTSATVIQKTLPEELTAVLSAPKIWPNPSNNYFTLRPGNSIEGGPVQLNVFDVTGRLVYNQKGISNKEFRFGDRFEPGLYFIEVMQNGKRSTFKLVKQ